MCGIEREVDLILFLCDSAPVAGSGLMEVIFGEIIWEAINLFVISLFSLHQTIGNTSRELSSSLVWPFLIFFVLNEP